MQGFRRLAVRLSSTLAKEIDRVESDERLISQFAPVMKVLSLEGILGWTTEAAHKVAGGPYAHVAALKGNHRSEEHTSELQSRQYLVCRLLLEKKKIKMKASTLN